MLKTFQVTKLAFILQNIIKQFLKIIFHNVFKKIITQGHKIFLRF